jgi:hypothetical protein
MIANPEAMDSPQRVVLDMNSAKISVLWQECLQRRGLGRTLTAGGVSANKSWGQDVVFRAALERMAGRQKVCRRR